MRHAAAHRSPTSTHPGVATEPARPSEVGPLRRLTDRRLVRHHRWRLVGTLAAIVLVGVTVRTLWAAEAARAAWTTDSPVVVATTDLPVGATVSAEDLAVVGLPAALVPPGAVGGNPADIVGATVTGGILRGEPVATARLGAAGLGATAAQLAPGWRAVALPVGTARPPLEPGDRVELVAVAGGPGSGADAQIVTPAAEVLALEGDTLTVAVPADRVTRVVGAAATGLVAAVLVGQ